MPKKKRGSIVKPLGIIILVAVVAIGVVAWHDGLFDTVVSIRDINQSDIAVGTVVTIKGELILRVGNGFTVADGPNGVYFTWDGASPALNSIVIVRGTVASWLSLTDVTSFDA
ncbi:MAG: hypothetical protein RTU30_11570, partial [Candidatus Thorarchaeota archaeon]